MPFADSPMTMSDSDLSIASVRSLGAAMNFVLALAYRRQREEATRSKAGLRDATSGLNGTTLLWELAERYHPEEAWLAESHIRGERTFDELASIAPRGGLAPSFQSASQTMVPVTSLAPATSPGDIARRDQFDIEKSSISSRMKAMFGGLSST